MSELDDLVGGDEQPEAVEPVEEVEATGEETAETPAADEAPDEPHVPVAALQSERHKRQELERRYAELQAQMDSQNTQEVPNPIDDPEGALEHLRAEFRNELWTTTVNTSRRAMLREKPDYADKEARFIEMAQANPALVAEMRASEDPAEYAYETARKADEFSQLQNVDEYKAKMRAELRKELEAEMKAGGNATSQRQAEIDDAAGVGALATSRSATGQFVAEDDLSSVLDGR